MKKMLLGLLLLASLGAQAAVLDLSKSKVTWVGNKSLIDDMHTGTIKIKSGSVEIKKGMLSGGKMVIDMTSIDPTDLQGKWKKKLTGHLKDSDFFKSSKYPTSELDITRVTAIGGGKYLILADLTVIGQKKAVAFVATQREKTVVGHLVFNRTDFGLKYGSGSFFSKLVADKVISDFIYIGFELVLK